MSDREPGNREDRLTAWLRARLGPDTLLGDDAAVLPPLPPGARWVATVDSQIAGVHHPSDLDPALAARRLLAVNLSDAAAMGAEPRHALLALSGPPSLDRRRYFEGLLAACGEHGVILAGGDLARTAETAIATLTLLAELPPGRQPLLRSTARPGHDLWVGGTLGEAAVGLELLQRGAKVEATEPEATAGAKAGEDDPAEPTRNETIGKGGKSGGPPEAAEPTGDLSTAADGLGRFVAGRPARLPAARSWRRPPAVRSGATSPPSRSSPSAAPSPRPAPAAPRWTSPTAWPSTCHACAAPAASAPRSTPPRSPAPPPLPICAPSSSLDPLQLALGGGEDYVLLFTLPESVTPPPGFPCTRIGRITERLDLVLHDQGQTRPLPEAGWDHLRS